MVACQSSSAFHQFASRHPLPLHHDHINVPIIQNNRCPRRMHTRKMIVTDRQRCFSTTTSRCNALTEIQSLSSISTVEFLEEVTSYLDEDDIPWRYLSFDELQKQSEQNDLLPPTYMQMSSQIELQAILEENIHKNDQVQEMHKLSLARDAHLLAVGSKGGDSSYESTNYSFILNICPTHNLEAICESYQRHEPNASISQAVSAYARLNANLTNACINQTTIVHLHQDVWNRAPKIVKSRLRSKCGVYDTRIFARKTIMRRITKSEYIPFLEKNHLWGATGAKYGYGLFLKQPNNNIEKHDLETLVAVATFSNKRKVTRQSQPFYSYELLRFCTALDTTVVGGLTKLISAFVKETKSNRLPDNTGIDIITSIDRDFGSNTWPNFDQMEVMDPLPMFVGDLDCIRRHAVGAGLTPFEKIAGDSNSDMMTTSQLLRSGLPCSVMLQLDSVPSDIDLDIPWQITADQGFSPVFDAGVERLMLIVDSGDDTNTKQLWDDSMPCYVKEHYSSNKGVESMLRCIRSIC